MSQLGDGAVEAHCRRVAGWATQMMQRLDCSTEELHGLEQAALLHHCPAVLLREESLTSIASDLAVKAEAVKTEETERPTIRSECLGILESFHGFLTDARKAELAQVLEAADQFDEQFELEALDPLPEELVNEFRSQMPALRIAEPSAVIRAGARIPVFPTAAQRAMRLLSQPDVSFEHVELILRSDQVLASEMLRAANSSLNGPRQAITTPGRAIAHLGVDLATRVICAACLRPVFASRHLFDLWNHSLESAETAERLALASGCADPGEAFLAGLIHDIGRLAYSLLSCDYQIQSRRLGEYGCPTALIEAALTGITHAEAGALLLESWEVPSELTEAVRWHHDPTKAHGNLAAILYLTEFWTAEDEDLPSRIKLEHAFRAVGLSMERLLGAPPAPSTLQHFKLAPAA